MREIRRQEQSEKAKGKALSHISEAIAASKIQSLWKGAIARKKVRKAREEELIFIGMVSELEMSRAPVSVGASTHGF